MSIRHPANTKVFFCVYLNHALEERCEFRYDEMYFSSTDGRKYTYVCEIKEMPYLDWSLDQLFMEYRATRLDGKLVPGIRIPKNHDGNLYLSEMRKVGILI